MAYTVFPNEEQIATFKTKLTDEERWLLDNLKAEFSSSGYENRTFEIHVKPNLFLGKPDFIILEPEYSGWIIQVNSEGLPVLEQLIKTVEHYKSELINDVGINSQGGRFGIIIRTAVFLPNNDSQTESYPYTKILLKNDFNTSNDNATTTLSSYFQQVFKEDFRLDQTEYENVSAYLAPGEYRAPTHVLDFSGEAKYKNLCQSKVGKQKIKGVAGSGKTTVLAKRAVACSDRMDNGEILITYFNITIGNYIRDKILAEGKGRTLNEMGIQIQHFHSLYHWQNLQIGSKRSDIQYGAIFVDEGQDYERDWFDALITDYLIGSDIGGEIEFVIFADEKQNIYERVTDIGADEYGRQNALPVTPIPGAWNVLNKIYRTTNTEISSLLKTFSTEVLSDAEVENDFQLSLFESGEENSIFYTEMTNFTVDNSQQINHVVNKISEYINLLFDMKQIALGDIAVISSNKYYLKKAEYHLRGSESGPDYNQGYSEGDGSGYDQDYYQEHSDYYGQGSDNEYGQDYYEESNQGYGYDPVNYEHNRIHYPTTTTFKPWDGVENLSNPAGTDNKIDRPYKLKFFRNNDLIKFSTTHSFKGWEIPYVILVIPPSSDRETNTDFLTYTGLSRPKKGMLIINLNPRYTNFFGSQHLKIL